jgi:hypothetical protein
VRSHAGRVDDLTGPRPQRRQALSLALDRLEQVAAGGERVRPARLAEATHELRVLALEEQQLDLVTARSQRLERAGRAFEEAAGPHVDATSRSGQLPASGQQLGQLRDQRWRQVVDAEVAEVLERAQRRTSSGAGHSRDHHQVQRHTATRLEHRAE